MNIDVTAANAGEWEEKVDTPTYLSTTNLHKAQHITLNTSNTTTSTTSTTLPSSANSQQLIPISSEETQFMSFPETEYDNFFTEPFTSTHHVQNKEVNELASFSISFQKDAGDAEEGELPKNFSLDSGKTVVPSSNTDSQRLYKKKSHSTQQPSKSKKSSNKKRKRVAKSSNNNDMWNDDELITAWNKGIARFRKQQRGEPVTDSDEGMEEEIEEEDEDEEVEEDDKEEEEEEDIENHQAGAADQLLANSADPYSVRQLDTAVKPPPFPIHSQIPSSSHLTDTELLEKVYTSWYWAGYYLGIYDERRRIQSSLQ